ncbi:MAG: carboxypeptidase-like regulatory domain-containing protein, partial [bacterium]
MIFDLSAYQNDAQIDIEIVFIGAYGYQYYQGGDVAMLDNIRVWYVPSGDVEGHAYDGMSNPLPGVEIGFLAENPPYAPVLTDANGYYRFSNVPTEPQDTWGMYGFLDGVNYYEQDVTFITGQTVTVDWNMAEPQMVITPAVLEETMNPNEWRAVPISITNGPTGGPLHWTAEIIFGDPPMKAEGTYIVQDVNDPNTPNYAMMRGGDPEGSKIAFELPEGSRTLLCGEGAVFGNPLQNGTNAYTISSPYTCQQQFLDASA